MSEAINYDNFMGNNAVNTDLDGIEILVSMAKTGKINPWNVDIVDITDKYLSHMFRLLLFAMCLTL